jgi:hypothetical protein
MRIMASSVEAAAFVSARLGIAYTAPPSRPRKEGRLGGSQWQSEPLL